jgi:hypothetical protein
MSQSTCSPRPRKPDLDFPRQETVSPYLYTNFILVSDLIENLSLIDSLSDKEHEGAPFA